MGSNSGKTRPKDDVLPEYGDPEPPTKTVRLGSTFKVSKLTPSIGMDEDDDNASDSYNEPSFDFRKIDKHAREACSSDARTFEQLVEYLQEPVIKDPLNRDLWTVRAILVWLSERVSEGINHPRSDKTHPFGFLSLIREEKATYAELFTKICRQANLKCVTIYGQVKAVMYRPGDQTLPESSWNAVQINGNWRLVQPYWACRSVSGYQHGGMTIIENDQRIAAEVTRRSDGEIVKRFNDYYFLVRPDAFIYEACPYDSKWQLLPPSSTRTMEEFQRQACLFRSFAQLGLKLVSEDSCLLESHDGVCTIVIKADKSNASKLYTKYTMYAVALHGQEAEIFNCNRHKLVFNERADNDRFRFEIRFSVEGVFIINIDFGFNHGGQIMYSKCCSFRLQCNKRQANCKPLPYDVGDVGWGPGPHAMDAGLCRPSEKSGRVYIPPKDIVGPGNSGAGSDSGKEVLFDLDPNMIDVLNYDATLTGQQSGSDFEGEVQREKPVDLSQYVKAEVDTNKKQFAVKTTLPSKGEYALSIRAGEKTSARRGFKPVCHYLLTTEASEEQEAQQKAAIEKLEKVLGTGKVRLLTEGVRQCEETGVEDTNQVLCSGKNELGPLVKRKAALKDLRHYMKTESLEKLESAYQRCCKICIDDQQLLSAAVKRIEYLRAKQGARDVLLSTVQHWYYRDLEDAIKGFRRFCESPQDKDELTKAEKLMDRRRAFDAKLLVQIARPMSLSGEDFKKVLFTPGSEREALLQRLRDNLGSTADPDFANGIRDLISASERVLQEQ